MILSPRQLSEQLKRQDHKRLYILCGNDKYITGRCIAAIQKALAGSELSRYDLLTADPDRIEEAFYSFPLAGARTLVAENYGMKPPAMTNEETVPGKKKSGGSKTKTTGESKVPTDEMLSEIPDFLTVILCDGSSANRALGDYEKKFDAIQPSYAVVSVQKLDSQQAQPAIAGMAAGEGAKITRQAARLVFEFTGGDLQAVSNEIRKLAAFSGYGVIEEKHVRRLTGSTLESGVYDIIGAMERGDAAKAMTALRELLEQRTDPLMISAVLNTAYINLYRAKQAGKKKINAEKMFELFDYKKGDRKVAIAMNRERGYSEKKLEQAIEILYQLDVDLKSSPADRNVLIEQAVAELMDR